MIEPTEVLPHREPMVLIDRLVRVDAESAECEVTLRDGHPFAIRGEVPALCAIEWIAQSVGAHVGFLARESGEPIRIGYLLGARELDLNVSHVRVGERLHIEVRRLFGDSGLATYSGTVRNGEGIVAIGSVNVFQEEA